MKQLIQKIVEFRDSRNWKQFHNPKDLAISLTLEASELLENFQWKTSEDSIKVNFQRIEDELADVLIYALLLSNELDINPEQAIIDKIKKNGEKYPIDKAFGTSKKSITNSKVIHKYSSKMVTLNSFPSRRISQSTIRSSFNWVKLVPTVPILSPNFLAMH